MKVVVLIILWVVIYASCPFKAMAQQAHNTMPTTTVQAPDSIKISAYDNKIVVENAPINSKLEIYSVLGIRVKEITMKQPFGEYPVNIAKGYYIVRIGDIVRKIAIR